MAGRARNAHLSGADPVTDLCADRAIIETLGPPPDGAGPVSRPETTAWANGGEDEIRNRECIARTYGDQEVKRLQDKVALLAMQRNYWQQRSAEHLNACRAAEAKVIRLNRALAQSKARLDVTQDDGEPQMPVTVPSFQ